MCRSFMVRILAVIGIVAGAWAPGWPGAAPLWAEESAGPDDASRAANRGAFSLVDHTGRAVTNQDFLGRFMLVFFGYTHCPDICPTDLLVMSQALDLLGSAAENVQPLFITIDPERDTSRVRAEFVGHFHPSLIGLTGSPEQVAAAARVYRVRYKKFFPLELGEDELDDDEKDDGAGGGAQGHEQGHEQGGQYLMDHTAATYLAGPDGGGLSLYPHGMTAGDIAADIERFIDLQP